MHQVHAKEIAAVASELRSVAASQNAYLGFNGVYSSDFASLGIAKTVNRVDVVSTSGGGFCLKGTGVAGGVVLYYSTAGGISDKPCA